MYPYLRTRCDIAELSTYFAQSDPNGLLTTTYILWTPKGTFSKFTVNVHVSCPSAAVVHADNPDIMMRIPASTSVLIYYLTFLELNTITVINNTSSISLRCADVAFRLLGATPRVLIGIGGGYVKFYKNSQKCAN